MSLSVPNIMERRKYVPLQRNSTFFLLIDDGGLYAIGRGGYWASRVLLGRVNSGVGRWKNIHIGLGANTGRPTNFCAIYIPIRIWPAINPHIVVIINGQQFIDQLNMTRPTICWPPHPNNHLSKFNLDLLDAPTVTRL